MASILSSWKNLVFSSTVLVGGIVSGLVFYWLLIIILKSLERKTKNILIRSIRKHERTPALFLIPLTTFVLSLSFTRLPEEIRAAIQQFVGITFTMVLSWAAAKLPFIIEDLVLVRYKIEDADNLRARKIYTQLQFFKRTVIAIVSIIALALILMSFNKVRQLGTTILASAGVIGVIVGFAAQRTIATFIAGLQIAITQPIRIDDVVIVENEWGRIEEITLTYVVVRIWDMRRLILPITYFIEKPFQNWTRTSADILGTVFLYVDYTVGIQVLKEELHRILKESALWDGKVWNLQVTNFTERTVELRALMSARNASDAWNLRCETREKLLTFIQEHYPESLPKIRAELEENKNAE